MERVVLSSYLLDKLNNESMFKSEDGKILYKKSLYSEDMLKDIDNNKDKLSSDLYSFPMSLLYDDKYCIGYTMENYSSYYQLHKALVANMKIDKKDILLKIRQITKELQKIGYLYFDLHDENFLITLDGKFKAIDLDGCEKYSKRYEIYMLYNYLNIVLETIVDYRLKYPISAVNRILISEPINSALSPELREYLNDANNYSESILGVEPTDYLDELIELVPEMKRGLVI